MCDDSTGNQRVGQKCRFECSFRYRVGWEVQPARGTWDRRVNDGTVMRTYIQWLGGGRLDDRHGLSMRLFLRLGVGLGVEKKPALL